MNTCFYFDRHVKAYADKRMHNDTVKNLWNSFSLTGSVLELEEGTPLSFTIGSAPVLTVDAGREYVLNITPDGASVTGRDFGGLMRGFFTLLMKMEAICLEEGHEQFCLPVLTETDRYLITNRMIHICVFPEDDLYFIKKLIRLAGLCQYTHIVIEFWGMLQYQCLSELAWPNAFSKQEAAKLIQEVRNMGMEPVPMFNQLGHATASRLCYGKHVVLDQNPRLQELFTPDGWAWNIASPKVEALLKQVRAELYELFGEGSYMHIGCDEAYFYTRSDEKRAALPAFLHKLTSEVAKEGRRPMMWMDMLLERDKYENCTATCAPEEVEPLISSLHPNTVMVDWQYDVHTVPIPTSMTLKETGYDVVGAPWLDTPNYKAHIQTVSQNNLHGIMLTTWHTLRYQMPNVLGCAKNCGVITHPWSADSGLHEETATLLRRVSFEGNRYADCGWSKTQIDV